MTVPGGAEQDAAWVAIDAPLPPSRLAQFCRDVERLYRINPYLEFRRWHATAGGAEVAFRNLSNGRDFEATLTFVPLAEFEFAVRYDRGIKRETRFRIEPHVRGSHLVITDVYASGPRPDLGEVDRSLHAWGSALREYLEREARWGRWRAWRWYMRRVWVPMKPAARRITYIILLVTVAEIALLALVMAIYWAERSS
ncbi:MAG: hypothetical protein ACT4P8_17215 [Betaproteobacteria bacterium]